MLILLALSSFAADPDLSGRYTLVESPDALEAIHAAARDEMVGQLPWAYRALARSRVGSAVRSCAELDLALDPSTFRTRCDSQDPYEHDRSTPETTRETRGGELKVRLQVARGRCGCASPGARAARRSPTLPSLTAPWW